MGFVGDEYLTKSEHSPSRRGCSRRNRFPAFPAVDVDDRPPTPPSRSDRPESVDADHVRVGMSSVDVHDARVAIAIHWATRRAPR
jgi:hypothetical protein